MLLKKGWNAITKRNCKKTIQKRVTKKKEELFLFMLGLYLFLIIINDNNSNRKCQIWSK